MRYILGGPLSPGHDCFDFANELRVSVAPRESLFLSTRCALTRQALARGERSKSARCFLRASRGTHRGRRSRVFPPPARGRGQIGERARFYCGAYIVQSGIVEVERRSQAEELAGGSSFHAGEI